MRFNLNAPVILFAGLAVVGSMFLAQPRDAEARPKYKSTFQKKYANKLDKKLMNCFICHNPKSDNPKKYDIKKRNHFGVAVGKIIGKKNEKDAVKIGAALTKVEKEKSAIKDKTFGDLINAGKVPASKE